MKQTLDTKIRFWGGLRSIGGTVVSIEYGDSRVIFDFGLTYNPSARIFDGQVQERPSSLVRDYLQLEILPPIDGIYSSIDITHGSDLISAEEYKGETAVLISHLHLDHMAAMGLISSRIPVYLSRDSLHLYHVLEEIGEGVPGEREYQLCDYDQSFNVGEIIVTPIKLDHDCYGACAFCIQTPDGKVVYSGDLRLHGNYPEWTEEFIQKVKEIGVDALIMEGTTLRSEEELPATEITPTAHIPKDMITERNLSEYVSQYLIQKNGIGIFNIYHRNLDRIENMIEAAQMAGRIAVLEPETAYIAMKLLGRDDFLLYESEGMRTELLSDSLPQWKKELIEECEIISAWKINSDPGNYFLQNSYLNVLELLDMNISEGVYIHSNGMPLGSFDPAFENLQRILERFTIEYRYVGTSGHAIPAHLKYIVDAIDPKMLIPLHSFHPERLLPKSGQQLLPKYGLTYTIKEGAIKL